MSERQCVRLMISGRVQGVGYRWWAVRQAEALGLNGWIRNLSDGRVEALAAGSPDAVRQFVDICKVGPDGGRVDRIDRSAGTDPGDGPFRQLPSA